MKPRVWIETAAAVLLLGASALAVRSCGKAAEAKGRAARIETEYHAARQTASRLADSLARADSARRAELRALSEEAAREMGSVRASDSAAHALLARLRTRVPPVLLPLADSVAASCNTITRSCDKALAAKDGTIGILTRQRDAWAWLATGPQGRALALADTTLAAKNKALSASGSGLFSTSVLTAIIAFLVGVSVGFKL